MRSIVINNKKGDLFHGVITEIVLVALVLAVFVFAVADKVNARGVRQQVVEKQTALVIDSATPGMVFTLSKPNVHGYIESLELKGGHVHAKIDGLPSFRGYPYFTPYNVHVESDEENYYIKIT